jgi:hypothetical protein
MINSKARFAGTGQYLDLDASINSAFVLAMNGSGTNGSSFFILVTNAPSIIPSSSAKINICVIKPPDDELYIHSWTPFYGYQRLIVQSLTGILGKHLSIFHN